MFLTPLEFQSDNGYWVALTDLSRHKLLYLELPIGLYLMHQMSIVGFYSANKMNSQLLAVNDKKTSCITKHSPPS